MDRAQPPDRERGDGEIDALAHEGGHVVAGAHTEVGHPGGQRRRALRQLTEGEIARMQIGADLGHGDGVGGVAIAQQGPHRTGGSVIGGEPVAHLPRRV